MSRNENGGPILPPAALPVSAVYRACDPTQFSFDTTDELQDFPGILGQQRAVDAIRFGIGIQHEGYNLFAMGNAGLGRRTIVRRFLEQEANNRDVPSDWVYVFNFKTPHQPRALQLPSGQAPQLKARMDRLVEELGAAIPATFETDEYRTRRQEIESEFTDRQAESVGAIGSHSKSQGIALLRTPAGFGFAPLKGDTVMEPEEFGKLPEDEQKRIQDLISTLQEELGRALQELPKWRREAQRKTRDLNRQVTRGAVNSLIEELKAEYRELPVVLDYLSSVQDDVLDHAEYFQPREGGEHEQPTLFGMPIPQLDADAPLRRYQVNVLITHAGDGGCPIVYEDNPNHDNLVGRIEHMSQMGSLVTDFTLIKAGALHRANGGYLILDAMKVLQQPFAWEALKRALRSHEIRAESLGQELSLISTVSLEPAPIPLDVKVVMIGERQIYYLLHAYDPEFGELFKVAADFEEDVARTRDGADATVPVGEAAYAHLVATLVRQDKLRAFDRSAVARIIEQGAREAGDAEKLSVHMRTLADLLRETDYWTTSAGRKVATAADVQAAIDSRIERASRVRQRLHEEVRRGTLLIDTQGSRNGQVNGLAVMQLGDTAFGMPHRITASARLGSGRVIDIEREATLGGPLHSKGVLILSGFLSARYAPKRPLSLAASLVFEQSYGGVEGDSASSAELYALLSALAQAPIRQSLAVTGSVNQHGDVQAIGGVNEKIEGFFDICFERGLTGDQGVLIPASNVKHLMLRHDVVAAIAAGQFHIYPIETIDQGIAILTGVEAGRRDAVGIYPSDSINGRVEKRLVDFADRSQIPTPDAGSRKDWQPGWQRHPQR